MANLVQKATNHMLIGPDWAMNMELCNLINNDSGIAKDSIKAVKRRMRSKNPKVQVLTLTVLETMVKNCGDVVHHQVAIRNILHDMVKLVKKNKDGPVREKILLLIDSWQDAFGGPNGRYPQYFMAYDELRRSGIMFPRRIDNTNQNFTPAQPRSNAHDYASPERPSTNTNPGADASRSSDLPGLSLSDIHNARSGMEVLAEMLNAIDPKNRQALRDEVIVELVEQCRTAERRVMQLVNSTVDEDLLQQGLALNDDLKGVLRRFDAIESGIPLPREPATAPSLLIEGLAQDYSDDVLSQLTHRSTKMNSTSVGQVNLPTPNQQPNKVSPTGSASAPSMDLLSGDMFQGKPESPQVASPNPQKALVPVSLLSHEEVTNVPSSSGFLSGQQGVIPSSFYNLHQQNDHIYTQQNGGSQSQFGGLSGQTNNTTYVVPWALLPSSGAPGGSFQTVNPGASPFGKELNIINPSSSALSPQQSASIYGGSAASGSSSSPEQAAMIYGSNQMFSQASGSFPNQQETISLGAEQSYPYGTPQAPNVSRPNFPYVNEVSNIASQSSGFQVYKSPLQSQPQYLSPQFPQEQKFTPGSYAYNQGLVDSQPVSNSLPSAPWSTENTTKSQTSDSYGNSFISLQDQHQLQFQNAGISAQMQNLSLQNRGSFYPVPPQQSTYATVEADYGQFGTQVIPKKEVKNDGLFKDLVDLAKVKKQG